MDFNIACALHFASKCEGYMFRDEYFQEDEEGVMGEGGYSRFKEDFEKITGVFEHKTKSDKKELIAQGNTRAKSSDYGMIT
jgi:hypothetical protein